MMTPLLICIPIVIVVVIAFVAILIELKTGAVSSIIKNIAVTGNIRGDHNVQNIDVEYNASSLEDFPLERFLEIGTLVTIVLQWLAYGCTFFLPTATFIFNMLCVGMPVALMIALPGFIVGRRASNTTLVKRSAIAGLSPIVYLVALTCYISVLIMLNGGLDNLSQMLNN